MRCVFCKQGGLIKREPVSNIVLKTDYLLKRGRKKQIDVSNLKSGIYIYIEYFG